MSVVQDERSHLTRNGGNIEDDISVVAPTQLSEAGHAFRDAAIRNCLSE